MQDPKKYAYKENYYGYYELAHKILAVFKRKGLLREAQKYAEDF